METTLMTAGLISREHREAMRLLRMIVSKQKLFFDRNENGSHDEFQRAADEFHDSIDNAAAWLEIIADS